MGRERTTRRCCCDPRQRGYRGRPGRAVRAAHRRRSGRAAPDDVLRPGCSTPSADRAPAARTGARVPAQPRPGARGARAAGALDDEGARHPGDTPATGNGLLTSAGEAHRTSRRLLQPAFSSRRITTYAEDMRTPHTELSDAWARGSRTVDMSAQMSTLTLQIVGRALFGRDLLPESNEVSTALGQAMASFRRAVLPGGRVLFRLPLSSRRASRLAIASMASYGEPSPKDERRPLPVHDLMCCQFCCSRACPRSRSAMR